jgi:hypothetical protein
MQTPRPLCRRLWPVLLCLVLGVPRPAAAQAPDAAAAPATRAEELRATREAKSRATRAHHANALESGMRFAETRGIFLLDREGFYPKLGTLTVGSGFAYGVGFRDRDLLHHSGAVDLFAATSTAGYFATEGRIRFPALAGKRLMLEGWAGRREYVREYFFGLGPGSARDAQSDYALRSTIAGGRAAVTVAPGLSVGGGAEFLTPRVGRGNDDRRPDVEDSFDEETAPGIDSRSNFLRAHAFAEWDTRQPRYPRGGGLYRLEFSRFDDRTAGQYGFDRVEADARHFFSVLNGRRVLGVRAFVSTSEARDGGTVPFYAMPTLGGNDSLRGFRNYRFRAPHALLLMAEYRWEIWSGLDGALFYDAGKTPLERGDLDFDGLQSDYGFGFRFNTNSGIIFRVDAGFGSRDGNHLYLVWGGVF